MFLRGLPVLDYASLSDGEVDTLYADAVRNKDSAGKVGAGLEIVHRLATSTAFFSQLNPFGSTNFPKYRAMVGVATGGMVAPPVASESVERSAAALEKRALDAAKSIGSGVVVVAASAAILALLFTFRKK